MRSAPTEPFIPLSASARPRGDAAEYRVSVVTNPGDTQTFKPLASELSPEKKSPLHSASGCEPRVSIQRDGDQVTGIRIQCGCGQVIELACIY